LKAGLIVKYDIADLLDVREASDLRAMMQEDFERRIGQKRFFRVTATPVNLGQISVDLDDSRLFGLLLQPPNPHGRRGGWDARPLPPLQRTSWGLENERIEFHHMKFIKNGHLEFWTAIDHFFCWQQDAVEMKDHPRLYPYAVVEHPLSFVRLYRALADYLNVDGDVDFQMQYLNIQGAILLPYQPESIGFMAPIDPIKPLVRERLLFQAKRFRKDFDPDLAALELIKDIYYEFGYGREHIPFFDETGHSTL
jgi:hypothetical protein